MIQAGDTRDRTTCWNRERVVLGFSVGLLYSFSGVMEQKAATKDYLYI